MFAYGNPVITAVLQHCLLRFTPVLWVAPFIELLKSQLQTV